MLALEVLKAIDKQVDSDAFLEMAKEIADIACQSRIRDAQVRNLQNIVNSTTRFSEILNFVKAQTGRHREWNELGPTIIENMEKIEGYAHDIAGERHVQQEGEIRLQICRHWVKMVVAEFLYKNSENRR